MTDLTHTHICQRINRRAETERQNKCMEEMKRRAAPLFWLTFLMAAAIVFSIADNAFGDDILYYADLTARAFNLAAQNDALVQCMNGQAFSLGAEGILRCQIIKYELVPL